MKVRMLKDWSWHKSGDIAEVFDPTAKNWVAVGIAEKFQDPKSVPAERAVASDAAAAETAMVSAKKSMPRKQ